MHRENCDAVVVLADPQIVRKLVGLAGQWRLPAVYQGTGFVDIGGLLSYSANTPDLFRQTAIYVDKILSKGCQPGGLARGTADAA